MAGSISSHKAKQTEKKRLRRRAKARQAHLSLTSSYGPPRQPPTPVPISSLIALFGLRDARKLFQQKEEQQKFGR